MRLGECFHLRPFERHLNLVNVILSLNQNYNRNQINIITYPKNIIR